MTQATKMILADIAAERQRQVDVEGHTLEQDQKLNRPGQLAQAAAAYSAQVGTLLFHGQAATAGSVPPTLWPFSAETYKNKDPRSSLIKAAALLVAELERLDAELTPSD